MSQILSRTSSYFTTSSGLGITPKPRPTRAAPPSVVMDHMLDVTFGRLLSAPDLKNVHEGGEGGGGLRGAMVYSTWPCSFVSLL